MKSVQRLVTVTSTSTCSSTRELEKWKVNKNLLMSIACLLPSYNYNNALLIANENMLNIYIMCVHESRIAVTVCIFAPCMPDCALVGVPTEAANFQITPTPYNNIYIL